MSDLLSFSSLLSTIRDPVLEVDEGCRIQWANPAAELLLGCGNTLEGTCLSVLIVDETFANELAVELVGIKQGEFACELDLKSLDGFSLHCEINLFRESGWPTFLVVIHPSEKEGQTTERLALQALHLTTRLSTVQQTVHQLSAELLDKTIQLAEEKGKTEAVLSSMGEGLLVIDASGIISQINQAACRILDLGTEEVLGFPLEGCPQGSKISLIAQLLSRKQPDFVKDEPARLRLDLQEKVVELSIAPIQHKQTSSEEGGVVLNLRDVTQQAELDRMKTDLISIVSHEIRSPLSNIIGYIDLVLTDPSHKIVEEQANFLSVAKRNGAKLATLVDDMLDLSRLEAGKVEMNLEDVDVEYLINFAVLSFHNEAELRKIVLTKRLSGDPHASGDMDRLQQVLTNLLSNAIKYTPEGGAVEISGDSCGETVILRVTDSGIGLLPEDQARLFQRFFRVRSAETRKISGTGLGLSIAKSIVDAHGGRLTVQSEYGKGSTFSVILPAWRG
jgi:two-component system, OmpR family, phosphate regulon sensor histidine kinase PhoR